MRKVNHFLFLSFAIILGCLFLYRGEAEAAGADYYKKYSIDEYDIEEYTIKLEAKCKLTVSIDCPYAASNEEDDDWDDEYWDDEEDDDWDDLDGVYVAISDSDDDEVYEKFIEDAGITKRTVTLPAGKYTLYIDSDLPCTVTLSGEYIPELSAKKMTLEAGKSKSLKVKGISRKVSWKSSNKSIATVSNKGVVKAKKAGKVTITATCRNKKLQCKVTVTLSYNDISKKMKAYAKKNKNFYFENVNYLLSGKKCRLYGKKVSEYKVREEDGIITEAQPCIELRKYNGKTELHFRMFVKLWRVSYGSVDMLPTLIQVSTSNRNIVLKSDSGNTDVRYDYETGCDIAERLDECTISKTNNKSLKKFETMLGQNSLMIKVRCLAGTYFEANVNADARKSWKKLVKVYRTL